MSTTGQGLALFIGIFCSISTVPAYAQASSCDESLRPIGEARLRYQDRGEWCEGTYVQAANVGSIELMSLAFGLNMLQEPLPDSIVLAWNAPDEWSVQLRANDLTSYPFYRLDAVGAGRASFMWRTEIASAVGLDGRTLGFVARARMPEHRDTAILPIAVGRNSSLAENLQLVVRADVEIDRVHYTLIAPDETVIEEDRILDLGYTPAAKPIRIELPALAQPGMHILQLSVDAATIVLPMDLRVYNGGR